MDIIETLNAAGQQELIAKLESLSGDSRKALERDIESQDWEELKALYTEKSNASLDDNVSGDLKPMPFKTAIDDLRYDFWKETGEILLGKGQVAAFLVAGGQGSRLGFDGPKGMFDIGLPSHKSLFQLQAERLQNLAAQVGHAIPWCIMTSPLNHEATVNFFTEHNFFGYARENIRFFEEVAWFVGLAASIRFSVPFLEGRRSSITTDWLSFPMETAVASALSPRAAPSPG